MTETKQSVWPLVLMLIWYAILLAGAGAVFFFGLAFGSELHGLCEYSNVSKCSSES